MLLKNAYAVFCFHSPLQGFNHLKPKNRLFYSLRSQAAYLNEETWREKVWAHRKRVYELLSPGFLRGEERKESSDRGDSAVEFAALDPHNPIYNFLLEYYNVRGRKGTKRLARWSPGFNVFLENASEEDVEEALLCSKGTFVTHEEMGKRGLVYSLQELRSADELATYNWYKSILASTAANAPVLNCYGLHEWAMQYQPEGEPDPPSRSYQKLKLRVSQQVINDAVEQNVVCCTHFDALRFFAPAAKKLNKHDPSFLSRENQLLLENPACLHSSMDLLKIAIKLSPFGEAETLADALEVSIMSRTLDVAASPYDARDYGLSPIMIETAEGKSVYKAQQIKLMKPAASVRESLLNQYETFLKSFDTTSPVRVPGSHKSAQEGTV